MSQEHITQGWKLFVTIVETGSISEAARRLNMPRATASRQLSALEARLGVRLLHRTTQTIGITEAGEALYTRAVPILNDACAVVASLQQDNAIKGRLRVSIPPLIGTMDNMFMDFVAKYPDVRLELHQASRQVDLIAEGFDVAVRGGVSSDQSLIVRRLKKHEVIAVAHTSYLAEHGAPHTPKDLINHRSIVLFDAQRQPITSWPGSDGARVDVSPFFACDGIKLVLHAVWRGLGIGLLPRFILQDGLDKGELVHVLSEHIKSSTQLSIVYPERAYLPAHTRALIEHCAQWFEAKSDTMFLPQMRQ